MAHPKAKALRHRRNLFDPDLQGQIVVIDIAGLFQAVLQVDIAMPAAFPAVKAAVGHFQIARAINRLVGLGHALFQRCQRRHHLEGRTGRISPLHRFRRQRAIDVVGQFLVVGDRNTTHEQVGVERRRRGNCNQIAGLAVYDHGTGAFVAQPRLNIVLQGGINGQLNVRTWTSFAPVQFAHDAARGVDFFTFYAGLAAQTVLLLGFNANLADLEPRDQQQLVGGFYLVQVIVADRTDIAQHMGKVRSQRVNPAQAHFGGDTGQGGGVH